MKSISFHTINPGAIFSNIAIAPCYWAHWHKKNVYMKNVVIQLQRISFNSGISFNNGLRLENFEKHV